MKTMLELLGDDWGEASGLKEVFYEHEVALIVQRAREEMRDLCADEVLMSRETMANLSSRIRSLPTTIDDAAGGKGPVGT